jgi:hypothetical protein
MQRQGTFGSEQPKICHRDAGRAFARCLI